MYIARNGEYLGFLVIQDPVRPGMKKTLNRMRRLGIDEVVMLTGDSKDVAAEVARNMDIDSYHAEILPEDKANYVMKMQKRGNVMMVGDGINDAPALAFADIGVSLDGNKTDIAAESAAIIIRSEDPSKLYDALYIGRETMRAINQNFTATIVVNSAAMLLGALGKISPPLGCCHPQHSHPGRRPQQRPHPETGPPDQTPGIGNRACQWFVGTRTCQWFVGARTWRARPGDEFVLAASGNGRSTWRHYKRTCRYATSPFFINEFQYQLLTGFVKKYIMFMVMKCIIIN